MNMNAVTLFISVLALCAVVSAQNVNVQSFYSDAACATTPFRVNATTTACAPAACTATATAGIYSATTCPPTTFSALTDVLAVFPLGQQVTVIELFDNSSATICPTNSTPTALPFQAAIYPVGVCGPAAQQANTWIQAQSGCNNIKYCSDNQCGSCTTYSLVTSYAPHPIYLSSVIFYCEIWISTNCSSSGTCFGWFDGQAIVQCANVTSSTTAAATGTITTSTTSSASTSSTSTASTSTTASTTSANATTAAATTSATATVSTSTTSSASTVFASVAFMVAAVASLF